MGGVAPVGNDAAHLPFARNMPGGSRFRITVGWAEKFLNTSIM